MLVLNLLLFVLVVAGHTQILVSAVNFLHSRPFRCENLRHLRHIHDLLVVVFPIVFVWRLGIQEPGLLMSPAPSAFQAWVELAWGWKLYIGVSLVGAVGLIVGAVRYNLRRPPAAQLSNHSRTINVAEQLGRRPIGSGPFRFMTRLPGNEQFQIEVSEKDYRLPRLPQEWDGLSILQLTDLHFFGAVDRPYFEHVTELAAEMQADLLVFTGDLIDDPRLLEWLPTTLARLDAPLGRFFILGNHDWMRDPDQIRQSMIDIGWRDVAGATVSLSHKGHDLIIGGSERPWMGEHPKFSLAPDDAFRLLLSHTPDNIGWARRHHVDLMLSGHNHGGQVALPIIGPVYAPSSYGCRYAAGVFWEDPTLLYVSRGISGRHPLRWNCKPELTKLVLKAEIASAKNVCHALPVSSLKPAPVR